MFTSKDLKWLEWARTGAKIFSTCGRRQYMALVVSKGGRLLGTGYNGSPPGALHCNEGGCPRLYEQPPHGSPYDSCVAVHAEANALIFSDRTEREGGTLYICGPPCWDCGKLIAGSGVRRLVYLSDPAYEDWGRVADLLAQAGIDIEPVEPEDL